MFFDEYSLLSFFQKPFSSPKLRQNTYDEKQIHWNDKEHSIYYLCFASILSFRQCFVNSVQRAYVRSTPHRSVKPICCVNVPIKKMLTVEDEVLETKSHWIINFLLLKILVLINKKRRMKFVQHQSWKHNTNENFQVFYILNFLVLTISIPIELFLLYQLFATKKVIYTVQNLYKYKIEDFTWYLSFLSFFSLIRVFSQAFLLAARRRFY